MEQTQLKFVDTVGGDFSGVFARAVSPDGTAPAPGVFYSANA